MPGVAARLPVTPWSSDDTLKFSGDSESLGDMVFGFLGEDSSGSSCNSGGGWVHGEDCGDGADGEEGFDNVEGSKAFWEEQDQLVQAILCRTSSIESKIRQVTKEALRELKLKETYCVCRRRVAGVCQNCAEKEVWGQLQTAGYNSAICKSKWKSSPDIPSGEHSYMEVVDRSSAKKGEVRVVIELNFRAEFEMARASAEYNLLVSRLPEVFVGKSERLKALIKILCHAAKKCMKEKKMHMGPWRKHKYMQAKWFGTCERTAPAPMSPVDFPGRLPRQRVSMLTFELLENLPAAGLNFKAVEVV